ncbi:hypothetical protein K491DRAFT_775321 [Lophiostoma macrostomum CBS 122681]|uniref:Heterokaryon incompatibility domain-containing protein n=1 Tax=Lophiostoma macrostomum CBS 122681 TaxID=1314788 RepID=A0A6A6TMN9_9PLEO|nr:hypothetical protein K491DRAFT_775321 [Lophiostoma macrostomum CBS 122681]
MYDYDELPDGFIRLLTVTPGQEDQPLVGILQVAHIDQLPTYEAFSYVWDLQDSLYPFRITYDDSEVPSSPAEIVRPERHIFITQGLADGIQTFRHSSSPLVMWVDQICIDQSSLKERSAHVRLMGKVYERATTVLVWLGPTSADEATIVKNELQDYILERAKNNDGYLFIFDQPFSFDIHTDPMPYETEMPSQDPGNSTTLSSGWAALKRLLELPYWERAWSIYELTLAASKRALWGGIEINLDVLYDTLSWILYCVEKQSVGAGRNIIPRLMSTVVDTLSPRGELQSLSSGLQCMHTRTTTDPRDKVYAFLGLLSEDAQRCTVIETDYTKDVLEVYYDVTIAAIEQDANLDILSRAIPTEDNMAQLDGNRWPTWIPDWKVRSTSMPLSDHLASADACGSFWEEGSPIPKVSLSVKTAQNRFGLSTKGIIVGKISRASTFCLPSESRTDDENYTVLFLECISAAWRVCQNEDATEGFSRTVVCASGSEWETTGELFDFVPHGRPRYAQSHSTWNESDTLSMEQVQKPSYNLSTLQGSICHLIACLFAGYGILRRLEAGERWDTLPDDIHLARELSYELYPHQTSEEKSEISESESKDGQISARSSIRTMRDNALKDFQERMPPRYMKWTKMISTALKPYYPDDSALEDAVSTILILAFQRDTVHDAYRYKQLLSRFLKIMAHRRFFVLDDGKMGLGPSCLKESDVVVVLSGGRIPFILRPIEGRAEWRFVGECYVEGVMKGEAFSTLKGQKDETASSVGMFTLI